MGGEEAFKNELISFFKNTPDDFLWNNYYNHPNEPVHHVPFMLNEAGVPHLTQKITRQICSDAYGTDAYGLCGNEDVGQMSAWYVLWVFIQSTLAIIYTKLRVLFLIV